MVKYMERCPGTLNHNCFGQTPKSGSKVKLIWDFALMAPSIVVLGNQILNIKMWSLKLIIKVLVKR
jgi:hypothetical protein